MLRIEVYLIYFLLHINNTINHYEEKYFVYLHKLSNPVNSYNSTI